VPELPDITVYVERLRAKLTGHRIANIRLLSPFVVRTVEPPLSAAKMCTVVAVMRMGKRIVVELVADSGASFFLVVHLMVAGRLRWKAANCALPGKLALAAFDFDHGTLLFTEASKKKRASIHVVADANGLSAFDRGGLDLFAATTAEFAARLRLERHTIKRSLTDPTIIDGVGNAYSDEILHAAKLSPFRMTTALEDSDIAALHTAAVSVLQWWISHLRAEVGDGFPDQVTAFRKEMAVHGKYNLPCPVCGQKVQRIVYADNEANYCAVCQTDGRLLADRSLSRLLKDDWPRTLEELEDRKRAVHG
jgi:formamidopyrimidine-DNA glycosylase